MKRDPPGLSRREWDLLVIGGGIHGAFIAREAALRGLSTALVEKGDFASATSSHSQKIVHNGIRYLQHGDFPRLRQSVRERTALLRIAPHLVRPLPVLVPAYGHGLKGREILAVALLLHDLAGFDRNRGLPRGVRIPRGRTVGAAECLRLFPEAAPSGLTGGAIWYDGQVVNTERLIVALLHDLAARGGAPLNYHEVTGLLREKGRITGAVVRDVEEGGEFPVQARIVVNAAGPWLEGVCRLAGVPSPPPRALSRAVVLAVDRPLVKDFAVALPCRSRFHDPDVLVRRAERFFFITPWRGMSLVGSAHLPFDGTPDKCAVSEEEIGTFLADVNASCPSWNITRSEVTRVYRGLLPTAGIDRGTGSIQVEKTQKIRDHLAEDGVEGFVSVLGVKYTTARDAAVKTVDLVGRKLGRSLPSPGSGPVPVFGGGGGAPGELLAAARGSAPPGLDDGVLSHLVAAYGEAWRGLLPVIEENPLHRERIHPSSPVIGAEVVYGIREEMAVHLGDLVLRRTEFGSGGHPGREALDRCAAIAARELGWDEARKAVEIADTEAELPPQR